MSSNDRRPPLTLPRALALAALAALGVAACGTGGAAESEPARGDCVTCHDSRHLAMEAGEAGADYVAFGAFYPPETKDPTARAEPELLTWWQQMMELPCVAIGGITTENARPLVEAGADFLAVSAGVWRAPGGPGAAVKAFNTLFDELAG